MDLQEVGEYTSLLHICLLALSYCLLRKLDWNKHMGGQTFHVAQETLCSKGCSMFCLGLIGLVTDHALYLDMTCLVQISGRVRALLDLLGVFMHLQAKIFIKLNE